MEGPVLILDDNPSWYAALEDILNREDIFAITYVDSAKAMDEIRNGLKYKVALVDFSFPDSKYDGVDFFHESKRINPRVPVIIVSGYGPFAWADG